MRRQSQTKPKAPLPGTWAGEIFIQRPFLQNPAAPPVAPDAPKGHSECAECRWFEAARAKTEYDPALERLNPARNIPMMVSGTGAGSEGGGDDDDDDETEDEAGCDVDDEDDPLHLRAQLDQDDLWTELLSPDPKIVFAQPESSPDPAGISVSTPLQPHRPSRTPVPATSTSASPAPVGLGAKKDAQLVLHQFQEKSAAVHSASLNRLIQKLTPETGRPDRGFMSCFFMTYPKFTTTAAIVNKLLHRYFVPATESPPRRVLIRVCVLRALASLLVADPRDLSPADAKRIALLAREARNAGFFEDVDALEEAARIQQHSLAYSYTAPQTFSLGLQFPIRFHELDGEGLVRLHQQFCIIEYTLYNAIEPRELLVNWESQKTAHLAPNLRAMTTRFNATSIWATSLIAQLGITSEIRYHIVDLLIQLADYMRQSNNFQALNALVSGITKSCVGAWVHNALVKRPEKKHKLQELQELIEGPNWVKAVKQCAPPVIPFIGKYQSDIVHIDDSMPDTLGDGQILWAKQLILHRTISEMLRGKGFPYVVKIEPCLHYYCSTLPERMTEEQLETRSHSSRPPKSATRTISTGQIAH